jgi:hypothetical protein
MLNQLDGAKHPQNLRFDVGHALAETASVDREASTSLVGYAGQIHHRTDQRHAAIALEAYHLAERRGFEPGHEEQDWLEAEARVNLANALET